MKIVIILLLQLVLVIQQVAVIADESVSFPLKGFLGGIDLLDGRTGRPVTRILNQNEMGELADPFVRLVLAPFASSGRPKSLQQVVNVLKAANIIISSYLVGDGGDIPWNSQSAGDNVPRALRYPITGQTQLNDPVDILVVGSIDADSTTTFLQALAWDPKGHFNYYTHVNTSEGFEWMWNGNSWHALTAPTRGNTNGPFCGHVSGGPVMKERKVPWIHWHSPSSSILPQVLPPTSQVPKTSLWQQKRGADDFQKFVHEDGIIRWTNSRFKISIAKAKTNNGILENADTFLLQVTTTPTVNLITSTAKSLQPNNPTAIPLPDTFFVNIEALGDILVNNDGDSLVNWNQVTVPYNTYRTSLSEFQFRLESVDFRQDGDTSFAFLVPEPAFEDLMVIKSLYQHRLVRSQFIAAILMTDFPNPVYSAMRSSLQRFAPKSIRLEWNGNMLKGSDLEQQFVAAATAAARESNGDAAAQEFLIWLGSTTQFMAQAISEFNIKSTVQCGTKNGFSDYQRLGESRRRAFRLTPLEEFEFTLPVTSIPLDAGSLMMTKDATVVLDHAPVAREKVSRRSPHRPTVPPSPVPSLVVPSTKTEL